MQFGILVEEARKITWDSFNQNPNNKSFHIFHTSLFIGYSEQLLLIYGEEVDREIVALSSIMHDIARPPEDLGITKRTGRLQPHQENGAKIAREFLGNYNYPQTERVAQAILCHGGKIPRSTIEDKIIYDCQRLSDSSPALYSWFTANNNDPNYISSFFKKEFFDGGRVPPHFEYSQRLFDEHRKVIGKFITLDDISM